MYDHAVSRCEQRGCQSFHSFSSLKLQSVTQTSCLKVLKGSSFSEVLGLSFRGSSFRYERSSLSLCCWPLFSLFSGALCIAFSRWFLLDIRHSTLAFSCSLSSSLRCVLPILRPIKLHFAIFSTAPRLLSSFSLWSLSLYFQPIFTRDPFSTNLNYSNFFRLEKL